MSVHITQGRLTKSFFRVIIKITFQILMHIATVILSIALIGLIIFCAILKKKLRTVRQDAIRIMEERRSGFIAIISHQLRTPLSVIKGYLEGLLTGDQGVITDGQKDYLQDALKVNRDTIELVNDYLNVVKLDSEEMKLNKQEADLTELAVAEVKKLNSLARASNCILEFKQPQKALPVISVDVIKLKQVIENILTNAIKYSGGKGKAIIALEDRESEVVFSCKDNGIGIPTDEQEAVFTKFFRAKNILRKDATGSGLGLYLARMVVAAHGGKIWFESEENQGTTVFFSIPKESQ